MNKLLMPIKNTIKNWNFDDFLLIVGNSSDIFDFFNVEEMHGLKKAACFDGRHSAYIAGLCNQFPDDQNKMFIFLNINRLGNGYKDLLLIFHECMHLAFHKYNYEINKEEEMISYAEEKADEVYRLLKNNIYSGAKLATIL